MTPTAARRRLALAAAVGATVLAVLGYATFEFAGQVTGQATLTAQPARGSQQHGAQQGSQQKAAAAQPARQAAVPTPSAMPTMPTIAAPRAQAIVPVSAVAFGPNGTVDGDNPQIAARVLTNPAMGWLTQWYATPNFGALKPGTGLLFDMGRTVTISTVRLTLGSTPGADVQLRLGSAPDSGALHAVTTATAAGGELSLPLTAPVRARYVLVWFTKLPSDGAGTFQALVHQVVVTGQP